MKKYVLSLLIFMTAFGMAFAQSDIQPLVVIKYNKSESITVKQLKSRCETYQKQMGKKLSLDEKKMVLKAITEEKLILQAAQKAGISIPDSAVDQYFMQGMSQQIGVNVTEKELNALIKNSQGITLDELLIQQAGMNVAEYKNFLKNQLIAQQYVLSLNQAEMQKAVPTDEEIRLFYESNKSSFVWNDMMKMFIVLVPKGNNPEAAKLKCNDLMNKFVSKKLTVEQLTVQSQAEGSGFQAGEMILPKTETSALGIGMPYANLLKVFTQDEGYVSDLQETKDDFRFISVSKKYAAKILAISDVVQPDTTVTVYDYIRGNLTQQKQMMFVQQAAQNLANELNKPEYVEQKKTGAALDKLLDWGE